MQVKQDASQQVKVSARTVWKTADILRSRAGNPGLDIRAEDVDRHLHKGFTTRAYATLLSASGWQIAEPLDRLPQVSLAASVACHVKSAHGPVPVYAYTAMGLPFAVDRARRRAMTMVETHLATAGGDTAILAQNLPLFRCLTRFSCPDRVALFGGWIFSDRRWAPFLIGSGGFDEAVSQKTLFRDGPFTTDVFDAFGHDADGILPHLYDITRSLDAQAIGRDTAPLSQMHVVEGPSGWSMIVNLEKWQLAAKRFIAEDDTPATFRSSRFEPPQPVFKTTRTRPVERGHIVAFPGGSDVLAAPARVPVEPQKPAGRSSLPRTKRIGPQNASAPRGLRPAPDISGTAQPFQLTPDMRVEQASPERTSTGSNTSRVAALRSTPLSDGGTRCPGSNPALRPRARKTPAPEGAAPGRGRPTYTTEPVPARTARQMSAQKSSDDGHEQKLASLIRGVFDPAADSFYFRTAE